MSTDLVVVDGNNVAMRAIHAMSRPGQQALSGDGVLTGPLLVFINTLSAQLRALDPARLVVCWDGHGPGWRLDIDPTYKAARREKPEDEAKRGHFGLMKEFLTLAGIHHIERPGFEADDLIARIVHDHPALEKVILSNDKDFLQLLSATTEVVRVSSAGTPTDRWTQDRFVAERGYHPAFEPYVMALSGDVSDGIQGIPRIGPKSAQKILTESNWSFSQCIQHPRVKPHADVVMRNLRLVNLRMPVHSLMLHGVGSFQPTKPGDNLYPDLLGFLTRYRLGSVQSRLYSGTLWRDANGLDSRLSV